MAARPTHLSLLTGDAEVDACKAALGGVLSVPEQLYGGSYLRLSHSGLGVALDFTAKDALAQWRHDDLPAVRVGAADAWLSARQREVAASGAVAMHYDWTYTTTYRGTLRGTRGGAQPAWAETTMPLNLALVHARDPILFYDDVLLYESELDDHGCAQLSVKVRVMARGWYVLQRFWLRVDGVIVRLFEARILCDFNAGRGCGGAVRCAVRHCEGSFEELAVAGASASRARA